MPAQSLWTITEVARLSGVTSRTLRHYAAVGLLTPAGTGPGGRRLYAHPDLLRLQQILVLRELGVDLATIGEILDADGRAGSGTQRRIALLRDHHQRLVAESDRFARIARGVQTTIDTLERGDEMSAKDLYEGFDQSEHEQEARDRWGARAVDRGNASWVALGEAGQTAHAQESREINVGLASAMEQGLGFDDDRTQALVARHYAQIAVFWTPDAASYAGLGQMYVDDPRFTATYDSFAPGLARYLRDAITVFARTRLA